MPSLPWRDLLRVVHDPKDKLVISAGPLVVKGEVEVVDAQGKRLPAQGDAIYLWRCEASGAKPPCDGSHKRSASKAR